MSGKDDLIKHLKTGATTTCRAWCVTRKDGKQLGFTDHDRDLSFDGVTFKANTGFTAGALQKTSGLSVDNTEVVGALNDSAISELDIAGGRYDGADVVVYLLNWNDVSQRSIRFRGTFGEIRRTQSSFTVELRGLTEALNTTSTRIYQPTCPAMLGDAECRFDLTQPGFSVETVVKATANFGQYFIASQPGLPDQWFNRGQIKVLSGDAIGCKGFVKFDEEVKEGRLLELWVDFDLNLAVGDEIRIEAGCDKYQTTCKEKFDNFLNFRGFPHVPSSDWVTSYPVSTQRNDGGSRYK